MNTPPLKVGQAGYSLGYFGIPFAKRKRAIILAKEAFRTAFDQWQEKESRGKEAAPFKPGLRLFLMTGNTDLLIVLKQYDFRFSHSFQNALKLFPATMSTWIHAVPYESHKSEDPPVYKDGLLFQLFLKSRREPYSGLGSIPAAMRIAADLRETLDELGDVFRLNIYTTLGWPDCLLWGSFHGTSLDHLALRHVLERFKLKYSDNSSAPLFSKRLTLTGLEVDSEGVPKVLSLNDDPSQFPHFSPLISARTRAGEFGKGKGFVENYARTLFGEEPAIRGVDGEWDLVASPQRPTDDQGICSLRDLASTIHALHDPEFPGEGDFYEYVKNLKSVSTEPGKAIPLERMETRLLSHHFGNQLPKLRSLPIPEPISVERLVRNTASLERTIGRCLRMMEATENLTGPLRNAVSTQLTLFSLIARDEDNQSAIDYVISGLLDALQELLIHFDLTNSLISTFPKSIEIGKLYSSLQNHLREWCSASGRAVRQRALGSFEHLFSRPLSEPSYRGSLQKMLHTADDLMREYFGFLPSDLTTGLQHNYRDRIPESEISQVSQRPRVASIFTPIVTIRSLRYLDLVEIPSRYAFSIQLAFPQLLHEVGQSIFFRQFNTFVSTLQYDLIEALNRINAGPLTPVTAIRSICDHFSDSLIFLYGFNAEFNAFRKYLTDTLCKAVEEQIHAKPQRAGALMLLIRRLLVVKAVDHCRTDRIIPADEIKQILHQYRRDGRFISSLIDDVADTKSTLLDSSLSHTKSRLKRKLREPWLDAVDSSIAESAHLLLRTHDPRIRFRPVPESVHKAIASGSLVEIDDSVLVSEVFSEYYEKTVRFIEAKERPPFSMSTALGFSGLQAFRGNSAFDRGRKVRELRLQEKNIATT